MTGWITGHARHNTYGGSHTPPQKPYKCELATSEAKLLSGKPTEPCRVQGAKAD